MSETGSVIRGHSYLGKTVEIYFLEFGSFMMMTDFVCWHFFPFKICDEVRLSNATLESCYVRLRRV